MRKVYITVFVILVVSALLFISSLFYLDKEKHRQYYFMASLSGHDVGTIKIDKFVTDENLLYKSHLYTPYMTLFTDIKSRLTLDRKYNLISYMREETGSGAVKKVLIENSDDNISFVGTSSSEFSYLAKLPIRHKTYVFEEYSPVTYLPILENYDFSIGRAQAFNVITINSPLLPPMKRRLTLTSIRDDYIKIGSRKTKVECLLIRMKNFPQGMLYVAKNGRSLVGIEFPEKGIKIMRTFALKTVKAEKFILKSDAYTEEGVKFNNKKTSLAGTVTVPKKEGLHPAVLMIGDHEECDRDEKGLFVYLADMLSRNGFLTLRFDGRGIGASDGDSKSVTDNEGFNDAKAALAYLSGRKDIDPAQISIIGHDKGAFYAVKIAAEDKNVKSLILMSPLITMGGQTDLNFDNLNQMAAKNKWDEQYLKLAIKSRMETIDKVKNSRKNWISIMKTRCFAKKMRDSLEENPTDIIRKVECPVLIMHGKEDDLIPAEDVANLDKALEDSGNKNHKLIYYGYLGHFMGKFVNDGSHRLYYETDPVILEATLKWLEGVAQLDMTPPTAPQSPDIAS